MLHREIPFLRICVALCAGIVSGLYIKPPLLLTGILFFIVLLILVVIQGWPGHYKGSAYGFMCTAALFLSGIMLYTAEKKSLTVLNPEPSVYRCRVNDYPQIKPSSIMMTLQLEAEMSPEKPHKIKGSVLIYHKDKESLNSFRPGDILYIRITPVEITNRGNPYEFNYRFYMENQGIRYMSYTGKEDLIEHASPVKRKLRHRALAVRHRIIEMYSERGITPERLPLAAAIILGEKSMLEPDTKENFMKAGIMHIMAVSGLHAVILSMFIFNLLFFMNGRLLIPRIIITLLLLWAFAFVTGLTPSVLRATIMFSFLQAGKLMHRQVNGINSVLASAFILILIRPSVIFDAGFLLSYSAVIFIIRFYTGMYKVLSPGNKLLSLGWQSVSVTLIAQAGTLPLTLLFFNRFPPYFILTNFIIVPVSSLIVILGCIVPVIYPLKILSSATGILLDRLTGFTEAITAKAASLPSSSIENLGMTIPECIILSFTIFTLTYFILEGRKKLHVPLAVVLVYIAATTIKTYIIKTSGELIVYNCVGSASTGIRSGKVLYLYTDSAIILPEVKRHCASLDLEPRIMINKKPLVISAGGHRILFSQSPGKDARYVKNADFLIVNGNFDVNDFRKMNDSCTIIVTGNVTGGNKMPSSNIAVHSVKQSGAFIRSL
ncbi:MAG TPA: ComEC/Rec2 family competence protein [Bacteroidales bacterium]|nr:ComEC/Rec2 family competence protein [Bacteroidales bacterium]